MKKIKRGLTLLLVLVLSLTSMDFQMSTSIVNAETTSSKFKTIYVGDYHTAAITKSGDLYTWGWNQEGQLGNGSTKANYTPTKIMSNVKKASVSEYSSAAITKKGELYVWGSNVDGSLAGGTDKYILKPRKIMDNVVDVSLGRDSSACLTKNGDLYTWGNNYDHSLGDNETFRTKPKKIMKDVVQINSAWLAVIALKKTGDLYVWGGNFFSSKPKKIMSNVVSAACRDNSVCAIKKNGSLYYKMYNSKKAKKANRTLLFYTDYGPQTTVTGSKKKGPNLRRSRPERGARRGSGTETPYPPIFGRQAFFPRERLRMSRKIATFAANKPYLHYGIRRNRLQNTARDEGNVGTR